MTHRLTRRDFLSTSAGLAGAAALGASPVVAAAAPRRGGVLRFATRADVRGLDPHRNVISYVYHVLAATTQGLVDFNADMELVPGVAESWDISQDLRTYQFKLRRGVEFHNGRDVDAAAVKWNLERILDPSIGNSFARSALQGIDRIEALDASTLVVHLTEPSAVFLADAIFYPCNLIAPDSAEQSDTHPIGCGPFKFKGWDRFELTELERFENYFETGADGKSLPYLDGIVGKPKKEDRVRLTALRTGEVDLIDNMAYADTAEFPKRYAKEFQTWPVGHVGTSYVSFNFESGPFAASSPDGLTMRQAAAHAIDHEALNAAVFYGLGAPATCFYSKSSRWHTPEAKSWPSFDPDRARFLLRQAKAVGTKVVLVSWQEMPFVQQTGELIDAMWTDVGFKVSHEILPVPVAVKKERQGEFDATSRVSSYRIDPDGWYSRQLYSESALTKNRSRYKNERLDALVLEARRILDHERRRQIYVEVESIVNADLPLVYLNHVPLLQAGVNNLNGYAPAFAGPFTYAGGGVRTAWLA